MINPDTFHLIIEMGLDTIVAVLGTLLLIKAQDNRLRQVWGIMVLVLALSMLWDNYYWLRDEPEIIRNNHTLLSLPIMIKWYLFSHALSLFTIGSMRPGWISPMRIIALSQPPIIACTIALCYLWFNGTVTPLSDAEEIFTHLGTLDVDLRFGLFLLSVITPTCTILVPVIGKRFGKRRLSNGMYIYIAGSGLLLAAYILFVLFPTTWTVRSFGFVVALLPGCMSVLYLREENPLSLPCSVPENPGANNLQIQEDAVDMVVYRLYERIVEHMRANTPFTDPDYALADLTGQIAASRSLTTQAIKLGGFTGFREYINFLRLEYFKEQAAAMPGATIKELMFRCGFTSRSSFYRHFAEQESMSPKEYLEKSRNFTLSETPGGGPSATE